MAQRYYDKLVKTYALGDFSRYKEGRVGLRWRTEKEVIAGKGHLTCGNKHCESQGPDLKSYELNFAYEEGGVRKNALVKLRVCPNCSFKLNYRKFKDKEQALLEHQHLPQQHPPSSSSSSSSRKRRREKTTVPETDLESDSSDSDSNSDSGSDSSSPKEKEDEKKKKKKRRKEDQKASKKHTYIHT